MNQKLSEVLEYLGFSCEMGKSEYLGIEGRFYGMKLIRGGGPLTWHASAGTLVIYDEDGYPWCARADLITERHFEGLLIKPFVLREDYNAYIPHTKDAGYFNRNFKTKF